MFETLKIIFLAVINGITSLLPVSSLAHFSLLKEVMGYTDENFNAPFYYALFSLSSALVLYCYYFKIHKRIFVNIFKSSKKITNARDSAYKTAGRNIFLSLIPLIVLAIPTSRTRFVGSLNTYFLSDGSLLFVGISGLFCALLMFISLWYIRKHYAEKSSLLSKYNAVVFGIYQIPAYIFPGLSHISVGASRTVVSDIDIKNILKETYLYIAPAYIIVNIFRVVYYYLTVGSVNIIAAVIGFAVSAVLSLIMLIIINKFFNKRAYKAFTIYTLIFSLIVTGVSVYCIFA